MNHVLILIPAHCEPEVLKYTLGTWLEHYDKSYRATVVVSLHTNYDRFSSRRAEIEEMSPPLNIVHVDPVDYSEHKIIKFSYAHAHCLHCLMGYGKDIPCTHVAFLDHDLEFKDDFIGWSLQQDADWVVTLLKDNECPVFMGPQDYWAPRPSVWHMVISHKLFDRVLEDLTVITPEVMFNTLTYDTAAKAFEFATSSWGMNVKVFPNRVFEEHVRHLWSLTFEHGPTQGPYSGPYAEKLDGLKQVYAQRFPNGIDHLLAKLK